MFQERFKITDDEWRLLFKEKWFPFASLNDETIRALLAHIRNGWSIEELTNRIVEEVRRKVPALIESWRRSKAFTDHIHIFEIAAEHFIKGEYISCNGLLYARIEGIMRSYHKLSGRTNPPSQKNLSTSVVQEMQGNYYSLLLPRQFEKYLMKVYFASFDPNSSSIDISRNSVAHGVADPSDFSSKSAVISMLITQQLYYFFGYSD